MKGLITLIKLSKRTLDELRRNLVSLENQKTQLEMLIIKLQEEMQHEISLASQQPEMSHFFGDFAKRIRARQEQLVGEIISLDKQIDALRDKIADAFGELKKFEIALANAKRRAQDEQKRKEDIMMDEIASQQHRRREEES